MALSESEINKLAKKLGKEDLEMSPSVLVDVLNKKHEHKESGSEFTFGDVQQYYIREKIPAKYGGYKVELLEGARGKYVKIHKETSEEEE